MIVRVPHEIKNKGYRRALRGNLAIAAGLNLADGRVFYRDFAQLFRVPLADLDSV